MEGKERQAPSKSLTVDLTQEVRAMRQAILSHAKRADDVPVVSITGSIGSGKSTALSFVSKHRPKWVLLHEQVVEWTNDDGFDWLSRYYKDQHGYCAVFQLKVIQTQYKSYLDAQERAKKANARFILSERSPLDGMFVFIQHLCETGKMQQAERALFAWVYEMLPLWVPAHMVYCSASVERCHARVLERRRDGEEAVDKTYLEGLARQYERLQQIWLQAQGKLTVLQNDVDGKKRLRKRVAAIVHELERDT